jgi:8-oxo-dGTP pyrophosphatase MutT (NUDIX family)
MHAVPLRIARRACAALPRGHMRHLHAPPRLPVSPAPFNSLALDLTGGAAVAGWANTVDAARGLAALVDDARAAGRNSLWLSLALAGAGALPAAGGAGAGGALPAVDLFSAAAAAGFTFHHARGPSARLLAWLRPGPCRVPAYGGTQVGVAGVVIDDAGRLLVVKERTGGGGAAAQWKFPGGLADIGEALGATAEREVREETGIAARFSSLLAFRHQHGMAFGVSDLYFLALLRPTQPGSGGATPLPLALDPEEIAAGEWVDAAAYARETAHPVNRFVARLALAELERERAGAAAGGGGGGGGPLPQAPPFSPSGAMVETELWIPVTRKWTRVYSAGAAPPIAPAEEEAGVRAAAAAAGGGGRAKA